MSILERLQGASHEATLAVFDVMREHAARHPEKSVGQVLMDLEVLTAYRSDDQLDPMWHIRDPRAENSLQVLQRLMQKGHF